MTDSPPKIFDWNATTLHRARANRRGDSFLVREACEGLLERLATVTRPFERGVDIASADEAFALVQKHAESWQRVVPNSEEVLPLERESLDLAVSVFGLDAVNDLPGLLIQLRHALKPDGLLVAAVLGGDSLTELRDAITRAESDVRGGVSPRVAPMADVRDLGGLLQRAGFALPVADVERTTVGYGDLSTLIVDLRAAGLTNALAQRKRGPLSRPLLASLFEHYRERHADSNGKLRATFDIVYLTAWVPHESQQKPMRPGTARMRLAEALGTTEQPAGEKTGR
ncbi:MAG: methyltransferase domain-containing protein [Alphaproteobacteria bacterium]|nr:methyltransferase domain-containing protein [Alphaproteobacteria bacterium]